MAGWATGKFLSRFQARLAIGLDKKHQYEVKCTLDAILKIICYEELYGFYKGMSTKIVQTTKCSGCSRFVHGQGRTCEWFSVDAVEGMQLKL
ncbi:Mitochondrial carrier domain-containing protein [Artemisia annua]|uniref:Mitochondrial carrier domain-containing protein n=1 Tax=Artemisia annua TaxID=35608 RepID=A0A2U1M167_ARTAN|nr:Mitochondrial carrier domain-containing protein [Artemisia annua]